ncbi:MAG: excinuclease ABC subunit UvrC [Alphaproteobacteria bacterium]|nr:excinuclease ABC subunit UvrC [Alphaproteobacteria bacterium]
MGCMGNPTRSHKSFEAGAVIIRAHLKTLPASPGVYRMMNADGKVLYVGKAKKLSHRVAAYTQRGRLPTRLQRMVAQTRGMEFVVTRTEAEALLLEANLVREYQPHFNILLRDDKSFPYIVIPRGHKFPGLYKHRGPRTRKGWYFGPFASALAVNETMIALQRGFLLRNCTDNIFAARNRPCLQYHIKRCTAPCVNKVSEAAYGQQVREARDFLGGKSSTIQQALAERMQEASDARDYETAASLRDRIKVLTIIQSRQDVNVAGTGDADIIAAHQQAGQTAIQIFFFRNDRNFGTHTHFPAHDKEQPAGEVLAAFLAQFYTDKPAPPHLLLSHTPDGAKLLATALTSHAGHKVTISVPHKGEKKRLIAHALLNAREALARRMADKASQNRLLHGVAENFGLPEPPQRIEVYDNSHIQGTNAVGAMIVAGPEGFIKKGYRKFNIRDLPPGAAHDDYAMMEEVFTRRFRRLTEEDPEHKSGTWPDLVLIDGGMGQLNRVRAVMAELGLGEIPLVAIAKGPDRNAGRERFFMTGRAPFSLEPRDPVLYYLQRLRDEAHRFVIGAHRGKRAKQISQTGIDEIPGIGAARKRSLLHHFGSGRAVAQAGIDDLQQVAGISASMAKKIYDYFHNAR